MSSRHECDMAFQYLGYPRFKPILNNEFNERYDEFIRKNPNNNDRLLINARRCNNICSNITDEELCEDIVNEYFDRVDSAEFCTDNPTDCIIEIKPPKYDIYIGAIIRKNGYTHNKLLRLGYEIFNWDDIPINQEQINLPGNILNIENLQFLVPPELVPEEEFLYVQTPPNVEYTVNSVPCRSPCIKQRWGYLPLERYGCWINKDQTQWDYCEPSNF